MINKFTLAPSILTADFTKLQSVIKEIELSGCEYIHLDIMDGVFVPPITFGSKIVGDIKKATTLPLDCHLMIVHPENHIADFAKAGASMISVHVSNNVHIHRLIMQIKSFNVKAGIVLNPHTPLSMIENIIDCVDNILLMSVDPGYGGQKFIEATYKKIEQAKKMITLSGRDIILSIDGGVNLENIKKIVSLGVDFVVVGSAIINSDGIKNSVKKFRDSVI